MTLKHLKPNERKAVNDYLKQYTGKPTILEAKMELGRRLALVYSVAYDAKGDIGIDVENRWLVQFKRHTQNYLVSHRRTQRADDWYAWSEMTINAAYRYVANPAHLMRQSGVMDSFTSRHFDDHIMILTWIDPNTVESLIREAIHADQAARDARRQEPGRLKKVTYDEKTGNKAQIVTEHKTFDRQSNAFGTGNYWANTMHGGFVRPYQEVYCGPFHHRPPGHLQEFDLQYYKDIHTPGYILDRVRDEAFSESVQFYVLYHHVERHGRGGKVIHGYILTARDDRLIAYWVTGPTYKSHRVVDTLLPYLAWKPEESE